MIICRTSVAPGLSRPKFNGLLKGSREIKKIAFNIFNFPIEARPRPRPLLHPSALVLFSKSSFEGMFIGVVLLICFTDLEGISTTKLGSHLFSTVGLVAEYIEIIRQKYKRHFYHA